MPDIMQSPPLQPGLRKLKKQDKDKLKNRMSMAFRKPFGNKDKAKSPEPTQSSPLQPGPPAYSYAAPASQSRAPNSSHDAGRRSSAGGGSAAGRSNKPVPHQSEGLVPRRSHVGSGAVGTSPPLPPLPRNGSIEGPTDPRVTALLGGNLGADELLPRNSFGPAFEVPVMEGLGIGLNKAPARVASPPVPVQQPPPRVRSPPHDYAQPQVRVHSPPPQQALPPQQQQLLYHHHSSHELHQQYSQPQQLQPAHPQPRVGSPPALARPVTTPAGQPAPGTYLNRRMSMLGASEPSAASKRLSMFRRGPPVFGSSSANSSTSTLEAAAATAAQAVDELTPEPARSPSPPQPQALPPPAPVVAAAPVKLLDEDEVGTISATSRDRIARLRGARSSFSAAPTPPPSSPPSTNGPAQVPAMRGANRRGDPTKAFTLAAAPQGFDVSLIKSNKSTFTPFKPLKPLPSTASSIARPSPLGATPSVKAAAPAPAPAPAPAAPSKDMYVLRPTVSMATQTPDWPSSPRTRWATPATTPPLAYASFPGGPPPPPPHDSPPQHHRANISPSIYSVASFDVRSRVPRNRAGRSSFYANGEDPNEEDEYEYEDQPPLPDEAIGNVERYSAALENSGTYHEGGYSADQSQDEEEEQQIVEEPVNYDVPYLTADPYDTPHLRPYDVMATPVPLAVSERSDSGSSPQASPALTATGGAGTPTGELTPSVTPTPYAAPTFSTPKPFHSTMSVSTAHLDMPESPRSRSRSRSPGPPPVEPTPLSRSASLSSADESFIDDSFSRPSSSLSNRRSSSEPMTPPTSAVSSTFPAHETAYQAVQEKAKSADSAGTDDERPVESDDNAAPVVMIRKASVVTSQVRKASLVSVTPPSSRPQSMVARKSSLASLANGSAGNASDSSRRLSQASSDGGDSSMSPTLNGRSSPRAKVAHFQLDLPGAGEVPPIPAVPSPIRREFGEAAFPFPFPLTTEQQEVAAKEGRSPSPASPTPVASPASHQPVFTTTLDAPTPSPIRTPSPAPSAPPPDEPLLTPVDFSSPRPASAPPEESSSLPLRRQSEPAYDQPIPRARTPGGMSTMSRAERAAKGRSYFLVQALMGESQPEGLIRDWAKAEGDSDEDDVSILGGESSSEDELSEFEE
ncbi:hypothetical protein JCM8547_001930 [Rhodosporidiobolus lusitaniae]